MVSLYFLVCFSCYAGLGLTSKSDKFSEELLLKPLYSEQIYAHFQFTTKWDTDQSPTSFHHSHIFPRIVGELIDRYNLQELHVSLTGGLWRYETWGYPVIDAAPGGEVWAWFKPNTEDVNKNWKELTSSLSGLLCASFNFVDDATSISPEYSFRPKGVVSNTNKINSTFLRYSSLPREIVCTENLTPWKKLLPCNTKLGLASLLNSGYIHNTRYHSLGLHLRPICKDLSCISSVLELQQTVSLVYDYKILGTRNWSLQKLFGQGVISPCPLASSNTIYIDVTSNISNPFKLTPAPDEYITSIRGGHINRFAKYELKPHSLTINSEFIGKQNVLINSPPALYAHQYITGYGKEYGGIVTKIYNKHWSDLDVVLLQCLPWYVPIYLHTLKIKTNGRDIEPVSIKYVPGSQRKKPYYLELAVKIPAKSVTSVSVDFDYMFLKWQEYPPDANLGFYVGSAVVSSFLPLARNFTGLPQDGSTISDSFNASRSGYLIQVRTENLIITLPTPDFSMPYNVICLACTVVALAFGPLHNITTKRLILKVKDKRKLIEKIKDFIMSKIGKSSENIETVEN